MSADNWTYCPRCLREANENADCPLPEQIQLGEAYGKVSREEYARLVAVADKADAARRAKLDALPETMREDYDIGVVARTNQFTVNYSCHCTDCGFEWSYRVTVELPSTS